MKKLFTLFLGIILSVTTFAQSSDMSKTDVGNIMKKDGAFLEKKYIDHGDINLLSFQTVLIRDITTGEKTGGLVIGYTHKGVLDVDEIDACIKCLNYIQEASQQVLPSDYTEYVYKTKDGVSFALFTNMNVYTKKMLGWKIAINPQSYLTSSNSTEIKTQQIPLIITYLEQSRKILDNFLAE